MGTNDEQLEGNSRGDNNSRIDLQLDLTTEEEQKNIIADISNEDIPAIFDFTQEMIDRTLQNGSGFAEGKFRIYQQMISSLSTEENILRVYYKYIGMDDMNAENRKTEIETNLTQKGYDYDAKIVDEHLEYEYIITKEDVLRSAGYLGKDNTLYNNKMIAEELDRFTCKVTDNTK